jgi:hypothetical protein
MHSDDRGHMLGARHHIVRITLGTLVLFLAAFVFVALLRVTSAGGASSGVASTPTTPDWFLPIWDAYDRNPAITPDFDFASPYSGRPDELTATRGHAVQGGGRR